MPAKRKNKVTRLVFTVSISVMIFGVPGYAAAAEPVLSEAPVQSRNIENNEISPDLLPAGELTGPPAELSQIGWAPARMIGQRSLVGPVAAYNRAGAHPILGFGWDHPAGNCSKWNMMFGLGLYISNYRDWNHPAEILGIGEPPADREQIDLFEKIKNALQVVGFQIRYDF